MECTFSSLSGFCKGVKASLDALDEAIARYGASSLFVYGGIVHNDNVVSSYLEKGVGMVNCAEEVPAGSVVVIRAHGCKKSEMEELRKKCTVIDTTCPLVMMNIKDAADSSSDVLLIGEKGHDEVSSIASYKEGGVALASNYDELLSLAGKKDYTVIVQTTFSEKKWKAIQPLLNSRFPQPRRGICQASAKRRKEIRDLAPSYDTLVVVGDGKSANSRALYEEGLILGKNSVFVSDASELDGKVLADRVFVTSGTSTPRAVVEEVVKVIEGL